MKSFFLKLFKRNKPKISLLIPFSSTNKIRNTTFKWILKYWKHELPNAEIVIGNSKSKIFCKAEALNDAARKAKGKIFVILDADAYLYGSIINYCADRILEELSNDNRLWYVPYRYLYRLRKQISREIIRSNPSNPLRIPLPPPMEYIQGKDTDHWYGYRYGAMIMIFPREAYDILGCFDERFKGWGGEDVCLLRALDTLYCKHKITQDSVLHLWHPVIGQEYITRRWEGQETGTANNTLSKRYHQAIKSPSLMRKLVDEGCDQCNIHKTL